MSSLALKKVFIPPEHTPPEISKKIFAYIKRSVEGPGSSNYRIDRGSLRSHDLSLFVMRHVPPIARVTTDTNNVDEAHCPPERGDVRMYQQLPTC